MAGFPRTVMLLGSGELGKEVAIAAQRLGCSVIACDRYAGAPAMQVADKVEVLPMTDAAALLEVARRHRPDVVIPEIEALAVAADEALGTGSFKTYPRVIDASTFPMFGWWRMKFSPGGVSMEWRAQLGDGTFANMAGYQWSQAAGWKAQ